MTKTALTHPTAGHRSEQTPHSSPSVARVSPEDYDSLTGWGIAALAALREHVSEVWLMTRAERVTAYGRGELTPEQIQEWTGRAPGEVPHINGEFAHIAATTPEACVCCPVCGDDEVLLDAGGVLSSHADYRHANSGKPGAHATGKVPVCPGSGSRPRKTHAGLA